MQPYPKKALKKQLWTMRLSGHSISPPHYDMSKQDKRLCIGFTWYIKRYWGTYVNPEAKLLMLSQVFDRLHVNRVEFHVDSRNSRSLSAMLYLGATLECIMKKHKIVQGDYVRDTALFSILKDDWQSVKNQLDMRLKKL